MTSNIVSTPEQEPSGTLAAGSAATGDLDPVAGLVRALNASHGALKDLWSRIRRAADIAFRSGQAAKQAEAAAESNRIAHHIVQAERPRRQAPLPRQLLLAAVTVALDGLACYFAAQALNGSPHATLIWTALFLAVLAGGELMLDAYSDRSPRTWRLLAFMLGAFVACLGVLRYTYLYAVGVGGPVPAVTGAALFTAATAGFLVLGYRALRTAETRRAWQARRHARAANRLAQATRAQADRDMADWNRLADTYIAEARHLLMDAFPTSEQPAVETALRAHLLGRS